MDFDTFRKYCMSKKGTTESFPFDDTTLVFKVGSKMFALAMTDRKPLQVNLKNEPSLILDLRDRYEAVLPGYHMNKLHWNTVVMDGTIPDDAIRNMIDDSYTIVFRGLKKSEREAIERGE